MFCCLRGPPFLAGDGFGHFALAVPDVYKLVDNVKKNGEGLKTS